MQDTFVNLRAKVRKAIDDIAQSDTTDSFVGDVDAEIDQALEHAATILLRELPIELLEPTVKNTGVTPLQPDADGSGHLELPTGFLRFVSLKISGWNGTVNELMEPGSNAAKMQCSKWSRGSADKPKAMLDTVLVSSQSTQVLRYWPSGSLVSLVYIPVIDTSTIGTLKCALKDECEKNLIYTACRIFLEGKKEHAAAEKFAQLATI